ncbi:isochorismate synthase [Actinomycetospora atypica]|uniref:isochorismate synthase n=1 Tax=Actinomycetospora atypica TaxID=1290095 RepID=A0ABV9YQK5_9PSEU
MTTDGTLELALDPAALLHGWRPGTGSWFSGPRGGLLTRGVHQRLDDPDEVPGVLSRIAADGDAPAVVVGALPFDPTRPAALAVPREITWAAPLGHAIMPGPGSGVEFASRSVPEPAAYEAMVAEALRRMEAGELEKVVLSRTLELRCDGPVDQRRLLRELAARGPSGYVFAVDLPSTGAPRTLVGASPELLLSRRDGEVVANPLAGSARRLLDPDEDAAVGAALLASAKDRHEHALVVDDVAAALRGVCDDLEVPGTPSLIRTDALWHLSTTIRGRSELPALDIARALHPTPAVGGVPRAAAKRAIAEIEPHDRGFYTGMVGWSDASGDGEWVVALRCGDVSGSTAHLYAGAGIVPGSVPASELAETATKLETMLASL